MQCLTRLGKLPGIQATMSGQTQVRAVMGGQILGNLWLFTMGKVTRRAHDSHAKVRGNSDCDHVFCHLIAYPHPRVITFSDDIDQPVADIDLQGEVGIFRQQPGEFRPENGGCGMVVGRYPNSP